MTNKTLSVFIDESGDFGSYDRHSPYYIVTMLFHNQSINISENISLFEEHIRNLGYDIHAVHSAPLIRRESVYITKLLSERKRLFNALFNFTRKLDINYTCVKIKKSECSDVVELTSKLSKEIAEALKRNWEYINSFNIIVYYDNGQIELTKILTSVFNSIFTNVEFRKVKPIDYKLFQAADLICTLELISEKISANNISNSETDFFESAREFKKNYFKHILKKRI